MNRMHVVLPPDLRERIRLQAQQERKSQAEVVRELIQKGLEVQQPGSAGEALLRLATLGKKLRVRGPKDWAKNHDAYFAKEV